MKLTQIKPQVYYLLFDTQYELCSTMMRMEEFYESPYKNIQGKYFTLEEFMDTYAKHKGNFTYTSDWNGFNVPSSVIEAFWKTFSDNGQFLRDRLLQKEQKLFDTLVTIRDEEYYLMATHKKGTQRTVKHELAHAYYYLDKNYRETMDKLVKKFKNREELEARLLKVGYCKKVLKDEIQAYLATAEKDDLNKKILDKKWLLPKEFKRVFNERNR
jgi:hypothetical protein